MTNLVKQVFGEIEQNKKERIDRFLHELKERIVIQEKYNEGTATQSNSIISILDKDIDKNQYFRMYQSLCDKNEPKDGATVITVRYCSKGNDEENQDRIIESFILALKKQIDEKGNFARVNDLCVTMDYIKYADMKNMNVIMSHAQQVRASNSKFEEHFVEKLHSISHYALKNAIVMKLKDVVRQLCLKILFRPKIDHLSIDRFVENAYNLTIKFLQSRGLDRFLENVDTWFGKNRHLIFETLLSDMVSCQASNECECFKLDRTALKDHLCYLTLIKHKEALTRCVFDLALTYGQTSTNCDNRLAFYSLFRSIWDDLSSKRLDCDMGLTIENAFKRSDNLLDGIGVETKIMDFLNKIHSNDMQSTFKAMIQTRKNRMLSEIQSEKEITIVLHGRMTNTRFFELCRLLVEAKVFIDSYIDHVILIVDGRIVTYEDLNSNAEDNTGVDLGYLMNSITITSLSKTLPANEISTSNSPNFKIHKTQVKKSDEKQYATHFEAYNARKQNSFAMYKICKFNFSKKIDDHIQCLMTKCQNNSSGKISNHYTVSIQNEKDLVRIHILYQLVDAQNESVIATLIYDTQPKTPENIMNRSAATDRKVMCLYNIPITLLDNLEHSLLISQIQGTNFKIPNILKIKSKNLVYTEGKEQDIGSLNPTAFVYAYIRKTYNCTRYWNMCIRIGINEIAEYEYEKEYRRNIRLIDDFVEEAVIEKNEFNEILHNIIFNRSIINTVEDLPHEIDRLNSGFAIEMFVTNHSDNCKVLNVCRFEENFYNTKIIVNPYKVFAKLLEDKKHSVIIKTFDDALKKSGSTDSFASDIFNDIWTNSEYFCSSINTCHKESEMEKREMLKRKYTKMMVKRITTICRSNQTDFTATDSCPQIPPSVYHHLPQNAIATCKIKFLVKTILNEFSKLKMQNRMKMTSIKLNKKEDSCVRPIKKRIKLTTDDNEFVNVEHLTCQGCQEHNTYHNND